MTRSGSGEVGGCWGVVEDLVPQLDLVLSQLVDVVLKFGQFWIQSSLLGSQLHLANEIKNYLGQTNGKLFGQLSEVVVV